MQRYLSLPVGLFDDGQMAHQNLESMTEELSVPKGFPGIKTLISESLGRLIKKPGGDVAVAALVRDTRVPVNNVLNHINNPELVTWLKNNAGPHINEYRDGSLVGVSNPTREIILKALGQTIDDLITSADLLWRKNPTIFDALNNLSFEPKTNFIRIGATLRDTLVGQNIITVDPTQQGFGTSHNDAIGRLLYLESISNENPDSEYIIEGRKENPEDYVPMSQRNYALHANAKAALAVSTARRERGSK